jgi:hypothetical protein
VIDHVDRIRSKGRSLEAHGRAGPYEDTMTHDAQE